MLKRDRSFRLHQSNHVTTSLFWHQWEFNLSESVTPKEGTRRDFIYYATGATGAVTGGAAVWALINQMNPSSDVQALSTIEVDIGGVEPGTQLVVKWLGKPVFIRRRTQEEIIKEREVEVDGLIDPLARNDNLDGEVEALDVNRTIDEAGEWLVMIGVCTHLGCVPLSDAGDFKGWFCPCHGSHYDLSGRIRRGPAPQNLEVPRVTLVDENTIRLG